MTSSPLSPIQNFFSSIRDELRQRRTANAEHRALQQELASYNTSSDVNDLLGVIKDQDGPEAEQIREILLGNLRPMADLYRVS
jgi:hypothetical protein